MSRSFSALTLVGLMFVTVLAAPAWSQQIVRDSSGRAYQRVGRRLVRAPQHDQVAAPTAPAVPPEQQGSPRWVVNRNNAFEPVPPSGAFDPPRLPQPGPPSIITDPPTGDGRRYRLGVYTGQVTMPGWGLGLQVTQVVPNSAAWGRLDPGDVILSVNGQRVTSHEQLIDLLQGASHTQGTATFTLRNIRTGQIEDYPVLLQYY